MYRMILGVVIWSIWEERQECKEIREEEVVVLINERIVKRASGRKEFWDFFNSRYYKEVEKNNSE